MSKPRRSVVSTPVFDRPSCRTPVIELVGLTGVGKSHLASRLMGAVDGRCRDVLSFRPTVMEIWMVPVALARVWPLLWSMRRAPNGAAPQRGILSRLAYGARLCYFAWQEEAARRRAPRPDLLLSQEGWFHKLRRLRKYLGSGFGFTDLPISVRDRLFRADVVIFITADREEICARRLRRKGKPVTTEAIAEQYAWIESLGQWREEERTRRDLADAAHVAGLRYVEIDYGPDFNVDEELLAVFRKMGILKPQPGSR